MSRQAEFLERQDRNSSTFNNTFQTLGSSLSQPGVIVKIINNSNVDIDVSLDGVTNHDFVPMGSFVLYDLRTNHGVEKQFAFKLGTQFYVKGAAAGVGSVYLSVIAERVF